MRIPSLFFVTLTLVAVACGGSTRSGQPPQNSATLIQNACNKIVGLKCANGPTLQQCTDSMNQNQTEAAAKGCSSEFNALTTCFADKLTDCSQNSSTLCASQLDALGACQGKTSSGSSCAEGVGGPPPGAPSYYQNCSIACSTWSVQCEAKTSPTLVCTCKTGPKAGTTFTATSCKDLSTSLAAPHCQG